MAAQDRAVSLSTIAAHIHPNDPKKSSEFFDQLNILAAQGILEDGREAAVFVHRAGSKRLIANAMTEVIRRASEDPEATAEDMMGNISLLEPSLPPPSNRRLLVDVAKSIISPENMSHPVDTGFKSLNSAMAGGLYPGKMYIFAARAKVGKTMMMAQIAKNIAVSQPDTPFLYLCLESSDIEIVSRLVAADILVNSHSLLRPSEDHIRKIGEQMENYKNMQAWFENAAGMTLSHLVSTISNAVANQKIKGVFVDYLQIVDGAENKADNRAAFVSKVSQTLARLAKSKNIWIVSAVQRNREGRVRESDGPLMEGDMIIDIESVHAEGLKECELYITVTHSRYTRTPYRIGDKSKRDAYLILREDIGPQIIERKNG